MTTLPTDKQISNHLTAFLPNCLTNQNNSLSNSAILNSKNGILFIFASNSYKSNLSNQFYLIVLNLSIGQESGISTRAIPINFKSTLNVPPEQFFQKTKIQVIKNQYVEGLIAFSVKKQSEYKTSQKIYVSRLNIQSLMKQQQVEFVQIGLNINQFHVCMWHAFVPFTFLILTSKSLLVYNLQKTTIRAQSQIQLLSLKKQNKIQCNKDSQFLNMSFVSSGQICQKGTGYTSLFRKFQLYLIDKIGRIYLFFPFLCEGIVISNSQSQDINSIKQNYSSQFVRLLQHFQLQQIDHESYERSFRLIFGSNQISRFQSRLKQIQLNSNNQSSNNRANITKDFAMFLIQNRTVTACCSFNIEQKCNIISITVIPLELQDCFLKEEMDTTEIHQFPVAQVVSDDQSDNHSQIYFVKPISNNSLYFLQESKCYKINLQGLSNHFKVDSPSHNQIIEVTKLFNAKQSKLMAINKNQHQIMIIRFNKNKYFYDCIALQGLVMTQNLKNINKEITQIFKNVQTNSKKIKNQNDPVCQSISDLNLSQIQSRLQKFSNQFKKCVENKMSRIKSLYDQIQIAKQKTYKHEGVNTQLRNLVRRAEDNDKIIKQLLDQKKKKVSPHQKQLIGRVQKVNFLLNKLHEESSKLKINLDQRTISDFQSQAKGIFKQMKQTRQQVQAKILQLRNTTKEASKR